VVGITGIAAANEGVTLTGTSDPGAQISLYDGWNWLAFVTTGSNGNWTYSGKAASNTTHTYGINSTLAGRETHGAGQGVLGSSGADTLTGSSGSDVIDGGAGNDVLTGGAGADTFAFSAAPNAASNLDRISDFTSGTDKLAFARSAFAALSPGELSAAAFIQAAAAVTTDQHVIYNQPTGIVSYDADGSGGGTAIAVVQLKAGQVLTAQDIKVV
jgi:Ca2+-binding RTX toxin-like protein